MWTDPVCSSFATTSTLVEKVLSLWNHCRTRSIVIFCPSGSITIGIREPYLLSLSSVQRLTPDSSDALMEECVRMMQQTLRSAPTIKKRAKSVYNQRNLGTIKERKKEKNKESDTSSDQTILRILRMR